MFEVQSFQLKIFLEIDSAFSLFLSILPRKTDYHLELSCLGMELEIQPN